MYRFSLQRVLDLRARVEERKAVLLVAANESAENARRTYRALEGDRIQERARVDTVQQRGARAGELQGLRQVLELMDRRLGGARERVEAAEKEAAERLAELQAASRDRRVIERLREKGAEVWRVNEIRNDGKQTDEIAMQRFLRATRSG